MSASLLQRVGRIANVLRTSPRVSAGLSVRATDEACLFLAHPVYQDVRAQELADILNTSFCSRFEGAWDDPGAERGQAWLLVKEEVGG